MQNLQHSWFDPTSLMSRTVQWDTLPSDFLQKKNILETLKSGLLQQSSTHLFDAPKKRGRQRHSPMIDQTNYDLDIINYIGVSTDEHVHNALYFIKIQNLILGLVGMHMTQSQDVRHASLNMIFIMPEWRRRGLAKAIAEHAGVLAAQGPKTWSRDKPLICHASSTGEISAVLVNHFFDAAKEHMSLLGKPQPESKWSIMS